MGTQSQTLFNGQYIFNVTDGAPLISSGSLLSSGLYSNEITGTTSQSINTTGSVLGTVTPPAGTYLAIASLNVTASSAGGNVLSGQLFLGSAGITASSRSVMPLSGATFATFQNTSLATNSIITTNGSTAISFRVLSSAGTVTINNFVFDIVRIA
jgi:hypothetical protein